MPFLAGHINTFQAKKQIDVDVKSNPYDVLTDPALLLTLDFMKPCDDDSLLSLLNVTCDTHVMALGQGIADGLMYWFELGYVEGKTISTGPESGCHFNQVVILFKEKLVVATGQELLVRTSCKNSSVMVTIES